MAVSMYRISTEYVWWKVKTQDDLEGSQVEVACLTDPGILPDEQDWVTASLISPANEQFGDNENWWVQALIGPFDGLFDLNDETAEYPIDYQTWIRVTDTPERPVRRPGVITIT